MIALLALLALGQPCDHALFATYRWPVGLDDLHAVASADLNHDGLSDLVVARRDDDALSIAIASGGAGFAPEISIDVGDRPEAVIVADLNDDGEPDIACVNRSGHSVTILTGPDYARTDFAVGFSPADLQAGDVDGDGDLDIVTANASDASVTLLRNDGATYTPVTFPSGGLLPSQLALADLDGDGRDDVLVLNTFENAMAVLHAEAGGLSTPDIIPLPNKPRSIAAGDADADGDPDIAVACSTAKVVVVFENDGGALIESTQIPFEDQPTTILFTPFDDDDRADLVIGAYDLFIYRALDGVQFELADVDDLAWDPVDLVVGDVTGDGVLDVASVREATTVTIHPGRGGGQLARFVMQALPDRTYSIETGDLDGDGDIDLAVTDSSTPGLLSINLNDGAGGMSEFDVLDVGVAPRAFRIVDLNEDGVLDIIVPSVTNDRIDIFIGSGNATYISPGHIDAPDSPYAVEVGHFDDDGLLDIASTNWNGDTLDVWRGLPNLKFELADSFPIGAKGFGLVAADIDGDGDDDLLASNYTQGSVTTLYNIGAGTFEIGPSFPSHEAANIALSDLDGDGDLDLAVANDGFNGAFRLMANDGAGEFSQVEIVLTPDSCKDVKFADLNDDGRDDLIVAAGDVFVYFGLGGFEFAAPIIYDLRTPYSVAAADFDADGRIDLAAAEHFGGEYGVALNLCADVCYADLNGDGRLSILDFVVFQQSWLTMDPAADCDADGEYTILDFTCFQTLFVKGCP